MNNKIRYPKNSTVTPVTKKPMTILITKIQIPAIIRCLLSILPPLLLKGLPVFEFLLFSFVPLRNRSHVSDHSAVDFTLIRDEMLTVMTHPGVSVFVCFYQRGFFPAFITGHN
jgi:hypothetical protein